MFSRLISNSILKILSQKIIFGKDSLIYSQEM